MLSFFRVTLRECEPMTEPRLIPLRYCSIERASRMLNIEIEDVEHFLLNNLIVPHVLVKDSHDIEIKPTTILKNKDLALRLESNKPVPLSIFDGHPISDLYLPEFEKKDIAIEMSTNPDSLEFANHDNEPIEQIEFYIKFKIQGDWPVFGQNVEDLINGTTQSTSVLIHPKYLSLIKGDLTPSMSMETIEVPNIQRKDIVISKEGLQSLYSAIYEGKELYRSQQIQEPITKIKKQTRSTPQQSDLIKALIHLLPDLKDKIEGRKKHEEISDIIDQYLEDKELNPVRVGEKNYNNWMDKAKYKPKD